MPLAKQLASGVRVIDVRLSVANSVLVAYHGICPERTPFLDMITTVHTFLTTPASSLETVIMSIKQENATVTPTVFSETVKSEIAKAPGGVGMWYLQNRIPTLGEVRGKIVMFSRFGLDGETWDGGFVGLGLHPNLWPDSQMDGFSWTCKDTVVRIHDW
jgi:1-phosphatidylinositol phosphodiesterase